MISLKIKCDFTPLLMAVIIGHFKYVTPFCLAALRNWPFMILAKVIRS
jgi:hypothetical protein